MQKRLNRSRCRSVVDLPTCIIIQERVELDVHGNGNGNGKGRFVERINARNLSTASNALRVPTAPQTHESLCCSEAVDIQDEERLQRCCGTAS